MSTYVHCCDELEKAIQDPTMPVQFVPKFREFGVSVLDGGSSYLQIHHCPWCGAKFPPSLRDQWFDALESQGIDPCVTETIPLAYLDEKWYF